MFEKMLHRQNDSLRLRPERTRATRDHTLRIVGFFGALAVLIPGMFSAPKPTVAMPPFAQALGLQCSACHTIVPSLNAYGRYLQRTGYASLDRKLLAKALPIWIGEALNYNSTAGAGTGTPRYSFGNLALHAVGYAAPDLTYHAQQFITTSDQAGGVDTLWLTYNNLFNHEGHLFVGKILSAAPSPYSQNADLDGPMASATVVGEHDWNATYGNRWGSRIAYVHNALDAEAGYYLASSDLNGATDFSPGDKTFQWKLAYALPNKPYEFGTFGSFGSTPVSTNSGIDRYRSGAIYAQIDPGEHGRPGLLAIYQAQFDNNPGVGPDGTTLGATSSRGASFEIYQPFFRNGMLVSLRHDFNDSGAGGPVTNGNAINVAFNVPRIAYLHGYVEANVGANSALSGASSGPTFKGMLWLTIPISKGRAVPSSAVAVAASPTPTDAASVASSAASTSATASTPTVASTSVVPIAVASTRDPKPAVANAPAAASAPSVDVAAMAAGKVAFAANCASCHGATGGGGVGPSLHGIASRQPLATTIDRIVHPRGIMPKLYPSPLSKTNVDQVAAYIRATFQ